MSVEDPRYDDAAEAVRRMYERKMRGSARVHADPHFTNIDPDLLKDVGERIADLMRDRFGGRASAKSYTAQQKARRPANRPDYHFRWYEDDMPPPRRDYYSHRKWKERPVEPGDDPFIVLGDGTIDLHPSQWSVR